MRITKPIIFILTSFSFASVFAEQIDLSSIQEQIKLQATLDIQKQIKKQSANTSIKAPTKNPFTQDRIDRTINRIMATSANKESFKDHQIGQYCQREMIILCPGSDFKSAKLRSCLMKNKEKLNSRCNIVLKDSEIGPPTKTAQQYYQVYIPIGSQFFSMQGERSIGVSLSSPSKYKGIPIANQITWFDTGYIRSIEPYNTAVSLNGIAYAPNVVLEFFSTGEVKSGEIHSAVNINGQYFSSGSQIKRDTPKSQWKVIELK